MTRTQRLANTIGLYWAKEGYVVNLTVSGDAITSDMIGGLPRNYAGRLNARSALIAREPIAPDHRKPNLRLVA
jgi:hypothetical protein